MGPVPYNLTAASKGEEDEDRTLAQTGNRIADDITAKRGCYTACLISASRCSLRYSDNKRGQMKAT